MSWLDPITKMIDRDVRRSGSMPMIGSWTFRLWPVPFLPNFLFAFIPVPIPVRMVVLGLTALGAVAYLGLWFSRLPASSFGEPSSPDDRRGPDIV